MEDQVGKTQTGYRQSYPYLHPLAVPGRLWHQWETLTSLAWEKASPKIYTGPNCWRLLMLL
jgi:hypothetical protein